MEEQKNILIIEGGNSVADVVDDFIYTNMNHVKNRTYMYGVYTQMVTTKRMVLSGWFDCIICSSTGMYEEAMELFSFFINAVQQKQMPNMSWYVGGMITDSLEGYVNQDAIVKEYALKNGVYKLLGDGEYLNLIWEKG